MGKIQGTLCISDPINLRKCKSGDHARGANHRTRAAMIGVKRGIIEL